MDIPPEPKSADETLYEFLINIIGKEGITFLNLDNAITAVKQGQRLWQAPFAIGLQVLSFFPFIGEKPDQSIPPLVEIIMGLASQIHLKSNLTVLDWAGSVIEPLEALYKPLTTDAHMLFHTRFALGVLLLVKGDEKRAKTILCEMAETKTVQRGPTTSPGVGLGHWDVGVTKALAAIGLQDFYTKRQDYETALYLATEAISSSGRGYFSESLVAVIPGLLESFTEKCERENDFGDWVDLFDRAANIMEICGEADASGDLPSNCKVASPQFLAWKFGQFVARFAVRNNSFLGNSKKIIPDGYQDNRVEGKSIFKYGGYGEDWLNGTMVASLLLEHNEHCDWQLMREQYVSMWEALPRYQWLSLSGAGTQTDLYWAARIGFADAFLEPRLVKIEHHPIKFEDSISPKALSDIQDVMDSAYSNLPERFGLLIKRLESILEKNDVIMSGTPSKIAIKQDLQKWLSPVWNKIPAKVVDTLVKAENYYRTGVETDNAKIWFNRAVEASLNLCFREPLVAFTQKQENKTIAVRFPSPKGVEYKNSGALRKFSLWEWGLVFELLSIPEDRSLTSLGTEDIRRFIKENFRELPQPALRELSRSLLDFCQHRKDATHDHLPRYEEEIQELELMRELTLGTKRSSVIAQIFQLFCTK